MKDSWLRIGVSLIPDLARVLFMPQEDMGQVLLAERKREVGEDAEYRENDHEDDPEHTLPLAERLGEDARDNAGDHADPDEEKRDFIQVAPVCVEAKAIEQIRHEREGAKAK